MAKYGKDIVKKICDLIETGDYTQADICKKVGIHVDTWHDWKNNKPEFSEAIKEADHKRLESLKITARISLRKKVEGYDYEEEHTTLIDDGTGKPKIKEKKTVKKHVAPSDTLIMYSLNNTDSDNFAYKERHEISTEGISIQTTSDEQSQKLKDLEEKLKKVKNEAD